MDDAGERKEQKALAIEQYIEWLDEKLKSQTRVTLTFDTTWWKSGRRKPAVGRWEGEPMKEGSEWVVGEWVAYGMFRKWVDFINRLVIGNGYKAHWKHSYFGYLLTREYQSRGTVHFHVIIDNWYPWKQASKWWWEKCGSISQTRIDDRTAAVGYALKYCLKSGYQPDIWIPNKRWMGGRVTFVDLNERYQEYMSQPFIRPEERSNPSQVAKQGLSEGRDELYQVKLNLQPDLDSPPSK